MKRTLLTLAAAAACTASAHAQTFENPIDLGIIGTLDVNGQFQARLSFCQSNFDTEAALYANGQRIRQEDDTFFCGGNEALQSAPRLLVEFGPFGDPIGVFTLVLGGFDTVFTQDIANIDTSESIEGGSYQFEVLNNDGTELDPGFMRDGTLPVGGLVYFTFEVVQPVVTPPANIIDLDVPVGFFSTARSDLDVSLFVWDEDTGFSASASGTEGPEITAIAAAGTEFDLGFAATPPTDAAPGNLVIDIAATEVFNGPIAAGEVLYFRFNEQESPAPPRLTRGTTTRDLALPFAVFDMFDYLAFYNDVANNQVFIRLNQDGVLDRFDVLLFDLLINRDASGLPVPPVN